LSYNIVFFDIDGTLLNLDHQIPADTKEAIAQLKRQGVHVAIATGRSPYHLKPVADELGIDTYVSFNGSYVVADGEVVFSRSLPREALGALEDLARQRAHPMVFLGAENCYANQENHAHVLASFAHLRLGAPECRPGYWRESEVYQAFLYCTQEEEEHYLTQFTDVSYVRWHPFVMDVLPKGGSKADGIEALLRYYGIPASQAVAFGDGLNDKEMLAFVGMGVAMGNAHQDLLPYADLMTRHVNEGGIRHGLQAIGLLEG